MVTGNSKKIEELLENLSLNEEVKVYNSDNPDIHGICLKLESRNLISYRFVNHIIFELTDEGKFIVENGSPEFNFMNEIKENDSTGKMTFGFIYSLENKWINVEDGKIKIIEKPKVDKIRNLLEKVATKSIEKEEVKILKKRKLIKSLNVKVYSIKKGENFNKSNETNEITEITVEMLNDKSYLDAKLKKYNFDTLGRVGDFGAFHPLMKIRSEMVKIFLEMGFEEMETGRFVESSFWNFDSLFQPQSHPSREMHDTFFLSSKTKFIPREYFNKVKKTHEGGVYESKGYQTKWSEEESRKDILRTHTTSITARYLYELAKNYSPKKYFSIDKVFRNESLDATHLAEFYQVEGVIIDKNLTLGHLKGVLRKYFTKLGLKNIKFKPAFNPYTEPSMEVFAYHEAMGKWIEVGNSGLFRPEMLLPMGFDEDVRAIAWGLAVERAAMIKYDIKNIRDLVGHKVSIEDIKNNEVCLFKD